MTIGYTPLQPVRTVIDNDDILAAGSIAADTDHLAGNGIGVDQDYEKAAGWYRKAAEQAYEKAYNALAWTYHLMGKYEEALPWAEKGVAAFPNNPGIIDSLATVYQGLGRYDEALEQFELCLKLQKEQGVSEDSVHETEKKIEELKELMKND